MKKLLSWHLQVTVCHLPKLMLMLVCHSFPQKKNTAKWTSCLKGLPTVTFSSLYEHFMMRPLESIVKGEGAQAATQSSEEVFPSSEGIA